MAFDNLINKFKAGTKQAADQMSKATKVAKLRVEKLTLDGERTRHLQTVGERTYELYTETGGIDGQVLRERARHEFTQIERIDGRIRDLDNQIADLQAMIHHGEPSDVTDAAEVTEVTGEGDASKSS